MPSRSTLVCILMVAIAATMLPCPEVVFGGESKQCPIDQPVKDSEEKEESSGKAELEDSDDFETVAMVSDGVEWATRTWVLHDLTTHVICQIFQHGLDHSRAPPAI